MNNFNFGEVLTRAWKNIWKHKVLWIFGILAGCARGGGGGGSGGGGNSRFQTGDLPFSDGRIGQVMEQTGQYFKDNLWIILFVILVLMFLGLISFALGMIGRIGMIKGTVLAEKDVERIAFGEVWSDSLPYFWRIFGLNFLVGLAVVVLIVPFVLLGVVTAGVGLVCLIPILCLLVPIGWALSIIIEQAQAAIVLEDLSLADGLKRGWLIVKSNPGPVIVMSLILGIGGAVIGGVISIPLIIAFVPIIVGIGSLRETFAPLYIALACCLAYTPVLIVLNGIMTAFIQSAWALTFMKLMQPKEDAPLIFEADA
jgi:hypothetical protein